MLVRLATRASALARWQAEEVARMIRATPGVDVELAPVQTRGDARADLPIAQLGGQGAFVKEVQQAVLSGRADAAVHSAKDLPSSTPPGLVLVCVPVRGDPRDCLAGGTLEGLAPGATVATGSPRRRAQLGWLRPDLTFTGVRGNIPTRLERIPAGGALVVAAAALQRLRMEAEASEVLEVSAMVPQVGQGAIAVECRDDDEAVIGMLSGIDDPLSHGCLDAERAFLSGLGGSCDVPVGAHATESGGVVTVTGMLASPDGRLVARWEGNGPLSDAASVGSAVAARLAAVTRVTAP